MSVCVDGTVVHDFVFVHVVYSFSDWMNPGGSARDRYLEDKFTCTRCLDTRYTNRRADGTNYHKHIEGSVPK